MRITITKGNRDDIVTVTRADGTTALERVPHKGPLPHDAVHYFVERTFDLKDGFWGLLDKGYEPSQLVELAKAGGHASAKRAQCPDDTIVQLLQAERLVECYEAMFWSGGGSIDDVRDMAETGCRTSFVSCPPLDQARHDALSQDIAAFAEIWASTPQGRSVHLEWE